MIQRMRRSGLKFSLFVWAALLGGIVPSTIAATLCVNPKRPSCYSTIGAAVASAAPGDTVQVAQGTYNEDVVIGKSLALIGENAANTIIDATGLANGVYVDGLDNPGLTNVTVAGFTVKNANFEGILVTNSSLVTVQGNRVVYNDKSLIPSIPDCPGIPAWETAESFDCGEGIHLSGVDHSTFADNLVQNNAGGILLSDDTGATHDNLLTGNTAQNNPYDCGFVLASHPPAFGGAPAGVNNNTLSGNLSSGNGLAIEGAGAGMGIFTFLPGGTVSGNALVNNQLLNNGLPGVAMHAHGPEENLNNNQIVGNYISGNGADTEDAATPGPTGINIYGFSPISGTVISQNVIKSEAVDIAVNTSAEVDAYQNNLNGGGFGVDNLGPGIVNAANNWWGCAHGPGMPGCAAVGGSVTSAPILSSPAVPNGR